MGIRTLHRRTAPAPANVNSEGTPSTAPPSVPPSAPGASSARIPADLMEPLRHRATTLRSYLALALTPPPRPHPAGPVTEPPNGSAPSRPHPNPHCQAPGPDATP